MAIARIENNQVVETRTIALSDVPEHKRHLWRNIIGDPPSSSLSYSGQTYEVTATHVVCTWTPLAPSQADYAAAIQAHVDITAQARGYGSGVMLASYASSTIPAWAAESAAFIRWRDAVWLYAYEQLAAAQSGQAPPAVAATGLTSSISDSAVTTAKIADAIESHMETVAQSRGYQDADRLASYTTSGNATWSAEAVTFSAWRDAVWAYSFEQMAAVQSGVRQAPTVDGLIAELPAIDWQEFPITELQVALDRIVALEQALGEFATRLNAQ